MAIQKDTTAYLALTTAAVVWGGSVVAQKVALGPFSAVEVSVFRGVGALCILIPLWWWQDRAVTNWSLGDLPILAALGVGVLGNHLFILYGLEYIDAGAAGVIIGASPAITAVLSSLILQDVPLRSVWLGCVMSFLGVALVSGMSSVDQPGDNPIVGGTLVVLALVSWALYTIGSRRVMDRLSALTVNWTTLLISILLQVPLLWTDHKILSLGVESIPFSGWMALFYVVVFATALGQQAWLFGVSRVGPSRAGVFTNLIPVSSVLLSIVVLGESLTGIQGIGILLVLGGVWLVHQQSTT